MLELNLPKFNHKIIKKDNKIFIQNLISGNFLFLTPEEWIRQHVINYLHHELNYPLLLMKLESSLKINQKNKRADIAVYNNRGELLLLVECKAPHVKIDEKTLLQASNYAQQLKPKYIMISNGIEHRYIKFDENPVVISQLPVYQIEG